MTAPSCITRRQRLITCWSAGLRCVTKIAACWCAFQVNATADAVLFACVRKISNLVRLSHQLIFQPSSQLYDIIDKPCLNKEDRWTSSLDQTHLWCPPNGRKHTRWKMTARKTSSSPSTFSGAPIARRRKGSVTPDCPGGSTHLSWTFVFASSLDVTTARNVLVGKV